jgi:hypothetical protein
MRDAIAEHVAILREMRQPVPQPMANVQATILDVPAA